MSTAIMTAVVTTLTRESCRTGTSIAPTHPGGTILKTQPGPTTLRSVKTVVILDSEPTSTHPMEAVLDRRGYLVLRAGTTEEALQLLAKVDLVIVEVPLTGSTSQTDAAVQIQRTSSEIPILLV